MGKIELQGFDVELPEAEKEQEVTEREVLSGPVYGTKEWSDHVLAQFAEDEMFNGNPLCAGLRRVAVALLGTIVSSRPVQVFPAMDPNGPGRATVVYEIIIDWNDTGDLRTFGDVAEVWHGNTDDLFCGHAAATACTKAEGRCLRKALMVKCLAAEELTTSKDVAAMVKNAVKVEAVTKGEMNEADSISTAQINFLEGKCKALNINLMKFINMGKSSYEKVTLIPKKTASLMLQELNRYQTEEVAIPEDIIGYGEKKL